MLEGLKRKWKIESDAQLWRILIVFTCTGFSAAWLSRVFMNQLLSFFEAKNFLFYVAKLLVMSAIYPFLLLSYGFIFREMPFFKSMLKKWFRMK